MYSGMSLCIRSDRGLYRDTRIRAPLRPYSGICDLRRLADPTHIHITVDPECQHVVRCVLMQFIAGLRHTDAEPGIISKFPVFCHDLSVSVGAVDARSKRRGMITVMVDKQVSVFLRTCRCQLRQRCFLCAPERMIVGKQ